MGRRFDRRRLWREKRRASGAAQRLIVRHAKEQMARTAEPGALGRVGGSRPVRAQTWPKFAPPPWPKRRSPRHRETQRLRRFEAMSRRSYPANWREPRSTPHASKCAGTIGSSRPQRPNAFDLDADERRAARGMGIAMSEAKMVGLDVLCGRFEAPGPQQTPCSSRNAPPSAKTASDALAQSSVAHQPPA